MAAGKNNLPIKIIKAARRDAIVWQCKQFNCAYKK